MLVDLNKEYLKDMGITLLGDVIAILKHANYVHESNSRAWVMSQAKEDSKEEKDTTLPLNQSKGSSSKYSNITVDIRHAWNPALREENSQSNREDDYGTLSSAKLGNRGGTMGQA